MSTLARARLGSYSPARDLGIPRNALRTHVSQSMSAPKEICEPMYIKSFAYTVYNHPMSVFTIQAVLCLVVESRSQFHANTKS